MYCMTVSNMDSHFDVKNSILYKKSHINEDGKRVESKEIYNFFKGYHYITMYDDKTKRVHFKRLNGEINMKRNESFQLKSDPNRIEMNEFHDSFVITKFSNNKAIKSMCVDKNKITLDSIRSFIEE